MLKKESSLTLSLLGAGLLPFIPGALLNWLLPTAPGLLPFLPWLGLLLLLAWGYLAFRLSDARKPLLPQALLMNTVALIMLMLSLVQALVVGAYWPNLAGMAPQIYFLPWASLASRVLAFLLKVA